MLYQLYPERLWCIRPGLIRSYRLTDHALHGIWQDQITKDIAVSVDINESEIKLIVAAGSVVNTFVVR